MKRIVLLLFLFLGIGSGLVLAQYVLPEKNIADTVISEGTASEPLEEKKPVEVIPGKPISLSIPKLGLSEVNIEHVGMDDEGQMEVPSDDFNVAWFQIGYRPGTKGSAVIAGHFDRASGDPAVFYNLNSMEVGDEFTLSLDDGNTQTYRVTEKVAYPYDNFPVEFVFGKSEKKMLNLITCDGTWNPSTQNYSNRLVVFSELVE